ncbi:dienelactone hydrolase family protein [Steroidobacter agaridevorans]|uniref:alpha/beta hydrolase n=1 Tax=Steroidobacter agaridevorans TaxID=2695856 RepID=UPI00137A9572|nr:alpha/beta hydrolase [Steroidobacter agaridevorans]
MSIRVLLASTSIALLAATAAASDTANVKTIDADLIGKPPSGEYGVVVEHDPSLSTHTIYRPAKLGAIKHPVMAWANGACKKSGLLFAEFLAEIASHGVVIIADGPPIAEKRIPPGRRTEPTARPSPSTLKLDGTPLIAALDWIEARNKEQTSRYFDKLDMSKVAVMGMSCGGLMAYGASSDKRVTTVGIWNSGLLEPNAPIFASLHSSVLIVTGGPRDVAHPNGLRDFETMPAAIPVFHAVRPAIGHYGTYSEDNGGPFGEVAVAWIKWQLLGDESAASKGMFVGERCSLCVNADWKVQQRALE